MGKRNDRTMVQRFKASNEPKKYRQIFKHYMFCITEWTQQTRPDIVSDKHKENKMALTSWLLLRRATEIHVSYFLKFFCSNSLETKLPPLLWKTQRHIKSLWSVNKDPLILQCFNLTHSHPSEKVTFERLVIRSLHQVNFTSWSNDFISWSSQFYNTNYTNYTARVRIHFGNSTKWPMWSRNFLLLQNN